MKKRELSDLQKARQHFIRATTEWIIGTGFALKGVRNLVREGDGKKLISDLTGKFVGRGLGMMMNLAEMLNQMEQSKSKRPKSSRKRTRKIRVE
jgi:hypothetical protein